MALNLHQGKWLNPPSTSHITDSSIALTTDPHTDFWQRSYYGFRNDNAPAYLFESGENFTFTAKVSFQYKRLFDQCGLIIYIDSENWFKASIEFENDKFSRLGSVVTNLGYSDWATNDISLPEHIYYRLSRRGPDFLIEHSFDGKANPPLPAKNNIQFGVYACSPSDSSFTAFFDDFKLEPCGWEAHGSDE